jgi:hypothetical protein
MKSAARADRYYVATKVQQRRLQWAFPAGAFRARLMQAHAAVGSECVANILVRHLAVEPLGIEVAAGPALGIAVLGIFRIGDDVEELGVAAYAPTSSGGRAPAPSMQLAVRGFGSRARRRSNSMTCSQVSPKS